MSIFDDIFGPSSISDIASDYSDGISIGGVKADVTSADNIANGNGKSADYGRGVGAVVGSLFGEPQVGGDVGADAFNFANKDIKPIAVDAWHSILDAVSK